MVRAQPLQALVQRLPDVIGVEVFAKRPVVEIASHLGGDDAGRAVLGQSLAKQLFAEAVTVHVSGVEKRAAQIEGAGHGAQRFRVVGRAVAVAVGVAADAPGAESHLRYLQFRPSQPPVTHLILLPLLKPVAPLSPLLARLHRRFLQQVTEA